MDLPTLISKMRAFPVLGVSVGIFHFFLQIFQCNYPCKFDQNLSTGSNLINTFLCKNDTLSKVWPESIILFKI